MYKMNYLCACRNSPNHDIASDFAYERKGTESVKHLEDTESPMVSISLQFFLLLLFWLNSQGWLNFC